LVLQMTGQQNLAAKGLAIAAVLNVALNAALIPAFGPLGAAFAPGASIILWNILLLFGVVHKLNINPTIFSRM
jgi:O-antigen/teichoic acid export membrane protein